MIVYRTALFVVLSLYWLLSAAPVCATSSHVIQDGNGGLIYWGGKYVNIKPSQYSDVIGRRTHVDQMEVIMKDDIVTVRITGPYFHNYVHRLKGTQTTPPGDLYIASQGWKVKGVPPYNEDVFETSEGWDYVVSFTDKAVYKLNFADITWTRPQLGARKFRSNQAWRDGHGQFVDDAVVGLTDAHLSFTFSVRNMRLGPEIGLHWTMMCGNDIIEGSVPLPAISLTPAAADPGYAQVNGVDALADEVLPRPFSSSTSYPDPALLPPSVEMGVGAGGGLPPGAIGVPLIIATPLFFGGEDSNDDDGPPIGPPPDPPIDPPPAGPPTETVSVSEPATPALLLLGMLLISVAVRARQRIVPQETARSEQSHDEPV